MVVNANGVCFTVLSVNGRHRLISKQTERRKRKGEKTPKLLLGYVVKAFVSNVLS